MALRSTTSDVVIDGGILETQVQHSTYHSLHSSRLQTSINDTDALSKGVSFPKTIIEPVLCHNPHSPLRLGTVPHILL